MGVAPKYLRDTIRLPTPAFSLRPLCSLDRREHFIPRTRTTKAKASPSLWNRLQLVLLYYHPIFLHPYHILKLVSFLGANRTKTPLLAHGCRGALYKYLNTIQMCLYINGQESNVYKRKYMEASLNRFGNLN